MKSNERAGFSLVELMIAVAIIGILSSMAIPTFHTFVLRSRTAEASQNLGVLFRSAASYYTVERAKQGQNGALTVGCTVAEAGPAPAAPKQQKQRLSFDTGFRALGFSIADYVYFSYGATTDSPASVCGGTANNSSVYTLYASGDLDGDTTLSSFELTVASDANNQLFHARGIYVSNELE